MCVEQSVQPTELKWKYDVGVHYKSTSHCKIHISVGLHLNLLVVSCKCPLERQGHSNLLD